MEPSSSIDIVQIDGLVVLKMITHARQNYPSEVTGLLLGLDIDGRLEVTNCIPQRNSENEDANEAYQKEMMKALRKVNVDDNTVGWFVSTFRSSFFSMAMIEAQYSYQSVLPTSVCLLLDPYRKGSHELGLRAYRLTENFMKVFAGQDFTHSSFSRHGVDPSQIMVEVPIQVHNSHLVHAFLYELRESKAMNTDSDRLNIRVNDFVEKNVNVISKSIDDYVTEQGKLLYYERQLARQKTQQQQWIQKRDADNALRAKQGKPPLPNDRSKLAIFKQLPKPWKLDTYLLTNRMTQQTGALLSDTAQGFNKLYVVEALNE